MNFRLQLDVYRGPMDLLLYLVRQDELDVTELSMATITDQFLEHLSVLEELNLASAGEFLDMASFLIELKSKSVLPRAEEDEGEIDDPREGLVERLLEYKQYKDAAAMLEDRRSDWQRHYPRLTNDLPTRRLDPAQQPIREVEMWDLVSAFGRILRDNRPAPESNIVYDETPITTYIERIHERLQQNQRVSFSSMFEHRMHKSSMISVFLAILELVRHHSVDTKQDELHGEIWIYPGDRFGNQLSLEEVDDYEHRPATDNPHELD